MDDLFDLTDPLDVTEAVGFALVAGAVLDDDPHECRCWCPCTRETDPPDDLCEECTEGRHEDET